MRPQLLAATAIATLLLAGCSAADSQEINVTTEPPAPSTSSPSNEATASAGPEAVAESASASPSAPVVNSGQAWADSKIQMWVDNSGIKSTAGFLYPYNLMTSWTSPEPGVISVVMDNSYVPNNDGMLEKYQTSTDELRIMGVVMFESIGPASPELETVTFSTANGKHSGSYSRARTGADPSDLKAWADEKYVQWLDAMNDTYESFCGATLTKLEVYRNCIPSDPHAYIDKVVAPAPGELVVTLADGPWKNNTYDTDSIPGVDFVAGNMMLNINSKAAQGEKVEQLTVKTQDGTESSTNYRG